MRAEGFASVEERRAMHDLMIYKRSTFIAHVDSSRSAQILSAVLGRASSQFPQPNLWEGFDVKEFLYLVGSLFKECLDKGDELAVAAEQEKADSA